MMVKTIQEERTTRSTLTLDTDGIVTITFKNNTLLTLRESGEILKKRIGFPTTEKKQLLLIDCRTQVNTTQESKKFYRADPVVEVTKALAVIITDPIRRAMGNFFLNLLNKSYPTKLFTNQDDAKKWLLTFK